jgi:nucleoside-diphosphate-sugar epimerase
MSEKCVLVIGAAGFVGRAITKTLSDKNNIQVYAGIHNQCINADNATVVKINILDENGLTRVINEVKPDVVINTSAYGVVPHQTDPKTAFEINALGPLNIIQAMATAGITRYIQLGSCSEYGGIEGVLTESMLCKPITLYGSSKLAGSIIVKERAASLGIDASILRLFNMWGEHESLHRLVPSIITAKKNNSPLKVTDGTQLKDYSYVGDVADWVVKFAVMDKKLNTGIVNVGSGEGMALREFVLKVACYLKCEGLIEFGKIKNRTSEVKDQLPCLKKLDEILPNRNITDFSTAIENTLHYFNVDKS